ncbi:MAG: DUF1289 domain-containing protein [Parvibaculaceae bacterium]|nr:DUF1289 domain-containing protein [Parvibaculaceae bacterium]
MTNIATSLLTIKSPCVSKCGVSGMTNNCVSCGRTLKEIAGWTGYTDDERQEIMASLPSRLEANKAKLAK